MTSEVSPFREALLRSIRLPELPKDRVYLEEHKFRKTWFPMFMRYFAGHEDGIVAAWATNVAGNFFREVYVVSDINNPDDTVLFVVPALMDRSSDLYPDEVSGRVHDLVNQAALNEKAFPGAGAKLLEKGMINTLNPKRNDPSEKKAWQFIYDFYGVDAPFLNDKASGSSGSSNANLAVEDYDDDL